VSIIIKPLLDLAAEKAGCLNICVTQDGLTDKEKMKCVVALKSGVWQFIRKLCKHICVHLLFILLPLSFVLCICLSTPLKLSTL